MEEEPSEHTSGPLPDPSVSTEPERVLPNQTIYIQNLNDKINKEQLKKSLYHLFSQFGSILDIVALKTMKLRGQAWIVFDSIQTSTSAINKMDGYDIFGKKMV